MVQVPDKYHVGRRVRHCETLQTGRITYVDNRDPVVRQLVVRLLPSDRVVTWGEWECVTLPAKMLYDGRHVVDMWNPSRRGVIVGKKGLQYRVTWADDTQSWMTWDSLEEDWDVYPHLHPAHR